MIFVCCVCVKHFNPSRIQATYPLKLDNHHQQQQDTDDNGNRSASVAEIRRKFDNTNNITPLKTTTTTTTNNGLSIEGTTKPISENRFKKQDTVVRNRLKVGVDRPILNGDVNLLSNGKQQQQEVGMNGDGVAAEMGRNHTSNFASYIWSGDYKNKEGEEEEVVNNGGGGVFEQQVGDFFVYKLILLNVCWLIFVF